MYRLSYLQAVEPDALPAREGIIVEVDPDLDDMGFPRVDVVARDRDTLIAYVREHWGDDDADWFRQYVVGGIIEAPMDFADYCDVTGQSYTGQAPDEKEANMSGSGVPETTPDDPVVKVVWKDEGDFGFITLVRLSDMDGHDPATTTYLEVQWERAARAKAAGQTLGVPFDPNRQRPAGTRAQAKALAREHDAAYEEV